MSLSSRRAVADYLTTLTLDAGEADPSGIDRTTPVRPVPGADGVAPPGPAVLALLDSGPLSVYELAARIGLPYGVTRLLIAHLAASGVLAVQPTPPVAESPDLRVLELVLDGLRAL